jgi:hypothetical protein
MTKFQTLRVQSVTPRVQVAWKRDGKTATRASFRKVGPNLYLAHFRTNDGAETSVEMRGDERVLVSYDVTGLAGVQRCRTHGPKIQRPAGHFDCEPCFKGYAAKAYAKKQAAKAAGVVPTNESPADRADRERREAAEARVDRLMAHLRATGKTLAQIDAAAEAETA